MSDQRNDLSKLLSSTALIFVGVLLSSVATLVERVIIGRVFTLELYGEFSLGLTILGLGVSVTLLGTTHGVTRYMSRYEDDRDVRGVWVSGATIVLIVSSVASLLLYLNAETVASALFEQADSVGLLRLFILVIPFSAVLTIGVSAIRGMENTRYKIYSKDIFQQGARIVFLVVFIWAGLGIYATGFAYLISTLTAIVVTYILFNRLSPLFGPFRFQGKTLLRFGTPLMLSTIIATLLSRMDTLMLAFFRSSSEVGLYTSAYPLSQTLLLFVSCFGYMYLPLTSRLDSSGERDRINNVYQITTKWSFFLTLPIFLIFFFYAEDVLTMFFGAEFGDGGIALAVLSLGFFFSATLGRNRETLSALGDTKSIFTADALALAFNLVLNLVFIPLFGFFGAAVASAISYIIRNLAINAVLWFKFDVTPISRRTLRTYLALPLILLPLAAVTTPLVSLTLVTLPVALVIGGFAVVVVALVTGCLQEEDLIAIEFVEDIIGVRLPYLRRYIPKSESTMVGGDAVETLSGDDV